MITTKRIKAPFLHKVGNMIGGICSVLDGLMLVLSLGNYCAHLTLAWTIYRRTTVFCSDNLKDKEEPITVVNRKRINAGNVIKKTIGYILVVSIVIFFIIGTILTIDYNMMIAFVITIIIMVAFAVGIKLIQN